ncbi:MAG: alpha-amylase [Acidobacteriaceae bacterium]|nr:alpha-amylase [Acidobacteriaceae bacterium]
MSVWPKYPTIYEINTWAWLSEQSKQSNTSVDLSCVNAFVWDGIATLGFDAVWLMGVWERSPAGTAIANQNGSLLEDFRRALPDFRPDDNVGSPYCVRRYCADPHLGGCDGLATARQELAKRGIRLILDFVPNHVAPDHPWVNRHPEYFIHGSIEEARNAPAAFIESGGHVFARGRDPYFPPWPDVLQLNAFHPGLRQAMIQTLSSIASQCDAVRCDMAMLMLNPIFERTWGSRAGQPPPEDYWRAIIPAVKELHTDFLFIAEAYWDLEWELQQQGFDLCYDKRLYDRLEHENAESVRLHFSADTKYQDKLLRFIENHDEQPAAAVFSHEKHRAAAVTIATLPGARLFHEGQIEGRKMKVPVFLDRRPHEHADEVLVNFYQRLLKTTAKPAFHEGEWTLCERFGWPDNRTYQNLLAWTWLKGSERYLVIVNLSEGAAQGRIPLTWGGMQGAWWRLSDVLSPAVYDRNGDELFSAGLYIDLGPWCYHLFQCCRI